MYIERFGYGNFYKIQWLANRKWRFLLCTRTRHDLHFGKQKVLIYQASLAAEKKENKLEATILKKDLY